MSFTYYYSLLTSDDRTIDGMLFLTELLEPTEVRMDPEVLRQWREVVGSEQEYQVLSLEMPGCEGCRYNEPGQLAHMEVGGCLAESEEE